MNLAPRARGSDGMGHETGAGWLIIRQVGSQTERCEDECGVDKIPAGWVAGAEGCFGLVAGNTI